MTGEIWRGSKKLLAFALTLMMVIGVVQAVPVRADEEDEVAAEAVNNEETTAADTQTWNPTVSYNNGALEINLDKSKIENGKTAYYEIWIDDRLNIGASYIESEKEVSGKYNLNRHIWTEGKYKVNIWASSGETWEDINKDKPANPSSCEFTYTPQTAALSFTKVEWSQNKPGTVTWTLSGDETSKVLEYYIKLYRDGEWIYQASCANTATEYDGWSGKMTDLGASYTAEVVAVSKNLSQQSNSEWVKTSDPYKPADTVNNVKTGIAGALWNTVSNNDDIAKTISSNNVGTSDVAKIVAALKTVSGNSLINNNKVATAVVDALKTQHQKPGNGLKMAMQNDRNMVELVEVVERMKGEPATATVSANDDEAQEIFGKNVSEVKIKVIGAKLIESGGTAKLTLAKSTTQIEALTNGGLYLGEGVSDVNAVAMDIKLEGCGNVSSALAIPVSVTVPVPKNISKSRLVILHLKNDNKNVEETLRPLPNPDGTVTFTVTHFSKFVFAEKDGSGGSAPSGGRQDTAVEAMITVAEAGATVKTKDITTLANSTMKALLKRNDVTLVMEYTYKGVDYVVTIPAGKAVDNDIPWYGPLYLAGMYGNGINTDKADKPADTVYVVKRGDTMSKIAKMSGMSLVELAKKNPQIKNLNKIKIGQQINR